MYWSLANNRANTSTSVEVLHGQVHCNLALEVAVFANVGHLVGSVDDAQLELLRDGAGRRGRVPSGDAAHLHDERLQRASGTY